jgi:hypothetical protein
MKATTSSGGFFRVDAQFGACVMSPPVADGTSTSPRTLPLGHVALHGGGGGAERGRAHDRDDADTRNRTCPSLSHEVA